jgi:hypothetical protein
MANVKKWTLVEGAVTTADPVTVADLPGLWAPGVAQRPEVFDMTSEEFGALVAAQNAPLVEITEAETEGDLEPFRDPNAPRIEAGALLGTPAETAPEIAAAIMAAEEEAEEEAEGETPRKGKRE